MFYNDESFLFDLFEYYLLFYLCVKRCRKGKDFFWGEYSVYCLDQKVFQSVKKRRRNNYFGMACKLINDVRIPIFEGTVLLIVVNITRAILFDSILVRFVYFIIISF